MKRSCAILLVLVVLTALLAACTEGGVSASTATPQSTPTITPTPTVPDYSAVDFSGIWTVAALYDSSGTEVEEDKLAEAGANFSLELLDSGIYFFYDAEGKAIGQGTYTVQQDVMTMTAGGQQTLYDIVDADTLRCTAQDGCVTVMKRSAEPDEDGVADPEVSMEEGDSDEPLGSIEEDEDEPLVSPEVSAPVETTQG